LSAGLETILVKEKFRILETNELKDLRELIEKLTIGTIQGKAEAALAFLKTAFSGLDRNQNFIEKILKGESQRPSQADRRTFCTKHTQGFTPALMLDLLEYTENSTDIHCKLRESVSALKCILDQTIENNEPLKTLYATEIAKRKHLSRSNVFRCVGSTLLLKGLEFDHAVILRGGRNWGTNKDLYVALTRGAKSVTLIDTN